MRRGRIIRGIVVLSIASSVGFAAAAGGASAASPAEICAAIASGNFNAGNYSAADLTAYQNALQNDSTIQGYCSPLVFVPAQTTTVLNGTTTVDGSNAEKTAPAAKSPASGPRGGVAGTQKTKAGSPAASPLGASKQQGSLPFTGAELAVFAIVGIALLAGGLLLRLSARNKRSGA